MSWVRATYSRRELIFSLVETTNAEACDIGDAVTFGNLSSANDESANQQNSSRRRNASLKVHFCHFHLMSKILPVTLTFDWGSKFATVGDGDRCRKLIQHLRSGRDVHAIAELGNEEFFRGGNSERLQSSDSRAY